eukprot:Gregarina_sp_Poly_1__2562@NODE_1695_length_3525_cov_107_340081_g674_i1_p1_GENE_NODE_1695_length_3525_cov_107_340081_g674_i1NODE_1695_length_3525_cov_107_340081_g674_i1_p1_ORF_typecomplete_len1032_score127_21Nucleoporin_N/PF08801_11/9_8e07Nucleoporin_N/PF08801_11/1_5e02_NODE_1695_length_3525_cov_107_340081_g674_i1573098
MIAEAVNLVLERGRFVQDAQTRALLGRIPDERNAIETEWLPNWRGYAEGDRTDHLACVDPDCCTCAQPQINVFWEKQRRLPPALVDSLDSAKFETSCGPALPQHVYYVADNHLYLFNFLALIKPELFARSLATDEQYYTPGSRPLLVTKSTIKSVCSFRPVLGIFPGDPVVVLAVATASELLFYGFQRQAATVLAQNTAFQPRTHMLLSPLDDKSWLIDPVEASVLSDDETSIDDIVELYVTALTEYTLGLSSHQQIQQLISDGNGHLFVSLEGDGCGIHEVVYRRESSVFCPRVMLVRQVGPEGDVCETAREWAEGSFSLAGVLTSRIKSCLRETQNKMFKLTLPISKTDNSLKSLHCKELLVSIDAYDIVRIYRRRRLSRSRQSSKSLSSRKRPFSTLRTDAQTVDFGACSPARRRRLDSETCSLPSSAGIGDRLMLSQEPSSQHTEFAECDERGNACSLSGTFDEVPGFSLDYLTSEFLRSSQFDCRLLGSFSDGFGTICESLLEESKNKKIYVLVLVTSNMKRLEIALDFRESFQVSLLNIQTVLFPEDSHLNRLPPSPSRGRFNEYSKAYKQGPIFMCATTQFGDVRESWQSPARTVHDSLSPSPCLHDTRWRSLITVGLHPAIAPLSLPRNDLDDGFVAIETEEPVRIIVDESSCWVHDVDSLSGSQPLKEGEGLLELAFNNAFTGSRFLTDDSSRVYQKTLFEKSFWVFMQTKFRRVIMRWTNMSRIPQPHSLSINLIDNVSRLLKHDGNINVVSSLHRAAIHPEGGEMLEPETQIRLATTTSYLPMFRSCPSVISLSTILTFLFEWDKPLLTLESGLCFPYWSHNRRRLNICRSLLALIQSRESQRTISIYKGEHYDVKTTFPEFGLAVLDEIGYNETKGTLIYWDQHHRLNQLVALIDLMTQVCILMELMKTIESHWQVEGPDFLTCLASVNTLVESALHALARQPLAVTLKDRRIGHSEFFQFTQGFLDLVYRAIDESIFVPRQVSTGVMTMLFKVCVVGIEF